MDAKKLASHEIAALFPSPNRRVKSAAVSKLALYLHFLVPLSRSYIVLALEAFENL